MKPMPLSDATRRMKPPENWDEEAQGKCGVLEIHDAVDEAGNPVMISAWQPEPEEIIALMGGAPVFLKIYGISHPVVAVFAGEAPGKEGST